MTSKLRDVKIEATKPEKPVTVDNAFKLIANDGKLYIWKLPQNKNDMSATVVLSKEELAKEIYNGKNPYPQKFGVRVSLCKREK